MTPLNKLVRLLILAFTLVILPIQGNAADGGEYKTSNDVSFYGEYPKEPGASEERDKPQGNNGGGSAGSPSPGSVLPQTGITQIHLPYYYVAALIFMIGSNLYLKKIEKKRERIS